MYFVRTNVCGCFGIRSALGSNIVSDYNKLDEETPQNPVPLSFLSFLCSLLHSWYCCSFYLSVGFGRGFAASAPSGASEIRSHHESDKKPRSRYEGLNGLRIPNRPEMEGFRLLPSEPSVSRCRASSLRWSKLFRIFLWMLFSIVLESVWAVLLTIVHGLRATETPAALRAVFGQNAAVD